MPVPPHPRSAPPGTGVPPYQTAKTTRNRSASLSNNQDPPEQECLPPKTKTFRNQTDPPPMPNTLRNGSATAPSLTALRNDSAATPTTRTLRNGNAGLPTVRTIRNQNATAPTARTVRNQKAPPTTARTSRNRKIAGPTTNDQHPSERGCRRTIVKDHPRCSAAAPTARTIRNSSAPTTDHLKPPERGTETHGHRKTPPTPRQTSPHPRPGKSSGTRSAGEKTLQPPRSQPPPKLQPHPSPHPPGPPTPSHPPIEQFRTRKFPSIGSGIISP